MQIIIENIFLITGILFFILLLFNIILTIFFLKLKKHYDQLTGNTDKKNLNSVLNEILNQQKKQQNLIKKNIEDLQDLNENNQFNFQKIGFLRFNPFKDTGGEQSFILSVLDKHQSGFLLSSLHNRQNTRVYAKLIKNGKGKDLPLSDEEKQVVDKADQLDA